MDALGGSAEKRRKLHAPAQDDYLMAKKQVQSRVHRHAYSWGLCAHMRELLGEVLVCDCTCCCVGTSVFVYESFDSMSSKLGM